MHVSLLATPIYFTVLPRAQAALQQWRRIGEAAPDPIWFIVDHDRIL